MTRRVRAALCSPLLAVGLLLLCGVALLAKENLPPARTVRHGVGFRVSPPLRELAKLPMRRHYRFYPNRSRLQSQRPPAGVVVDTVEQSTAEGGSNFAIDINVGGVGLGFSGFNTTFNYPDANIAVGDTQLVQWANNSLAVFDKTTGMALTPAIPFSSIWTTGPCSQYTPEGHPIVQWDGIAHRWLLAENAVMGAPDAYAGYACIAISTSPDATSTYYLYQFSLGSGYPDLAKWGIWSTSFFQSNDNFGADAKTFIGSDPCAYNRVKMLAGDPSAEQICIQLSSSDFALMPADIDSPVGPPVGQDEFLLSLWDSSDLALYSFHVDWSTVTGSITGGGGTQLFPVPAFTPACNGQYLGACVPQLSTPVLLDVLGDRLLYRLVYYNGLPGKIPPTVAFQHWLVVHDVTASGGNTAERWYEFLALPRRIPVTSIRLFQSGTYAPDNSNYRWMGSIARDQDGDILMGYSESSSDIYPSIAITGRLVTDPPGTMEPELLVIPGGGAYTGVFDHNLNRWGDYTSMRLDPDGCTLWYTNEYYTTNGLSNWSTQINSATFAGCQ